MFRVLELEHKCLVKHKDARKRITKRLHEAIRLGGAPSKIL